MIITKKIKGKDYRVQIDPEDEPLFRRSMCIKTSKGGKHHYLKLNNKIKMHESRYPHRIIMNAKAGQVIDHINGDTFDNRKCNLRITTPWGNNYHNKARRYAGQTSMNF